MKKVSKQILRILIVAVVSALIEIFVINIKFFIFQINPDVKMDHIIENDDFIMQNWDQGAEGAISLPDPMLIKDGLDMYVSSLTIEFKANKSVPYVDVFYTDSDHQAFGAETLIRIDTQATDVSAGIDLNKWINAIRIDPGDDEGLILNEFKVTVNKNGFNFSVARFVAMNMIYWFAVLLFAAQRPPKYNI